MPFNCMPFIGQDWRAPGERWVRTQEGWERMKLRPYGSESCPDLPLRPHYDGLSRATVGSPLPLPSLILSGETRGRNSSESSCGSSDKLTPIFDTGNNMEDPDTDFEEEDWLPHCFVKTGKSKEFVGCTSLSEAFHKLNMARAVSDIQKFNYVCKVVQILVRDKLQNLSGSARKVLLSVVEAIVLQNLETFTQMKTVKQLVCEFMGGLSGGQHCGSPKLLVQHQDTVSNLYELLSSKQPGTPMDCGEDSVTFLDLPRECLRAVLRKLPDHDSLLEAAKAHEALAYLVESEQRLWQDLCQFHFAEWQMIVTRDRLKEKQKKQSINDQRIQFLPEIHWRHMFFELKKFYGLKATYADMIHICCHCKALFWKKLGHPCISPDTTPSVRVTPHQFVDMLMFL